jgi:tetratricopeptide (TPR) repeat protein
MQQAEGHASELDEEVASKERAPLGLALARSVRARVRIAEGDSLAALGMLTDNPIRAWWERSHVSLVFSQAHERFLLAELLTAHGRYDEAIGWLETAGKQSLPDLIYAAPAHLKLGEILEKLGRREEAAEHYRRFADLWSDCDPRLQPVRREAELRLGYLAQR